jgi:hypothetical protein
MNYGTPIIAEILKNGSEYKWEFEKIHTWTRFEQIEILREFEQNMERSEKLLNEDTSPSDPYVIHCIPHL